MFIVNYKKIAENFSGKFYMLKTLSLTWWGSGFHLTEKEIQEEECDFIMVK